MGEVLIVKTGTTVANVRSRRQDFEVWIAAGMGLPQQAADVVRVDRGEALPAPDAATAVVVTGSAAMVTDRAPWSEHTGQWLCDVVACGTPLLAICYGHQLLAQALGGRVADNPRGRHIGTVDVELTDAASDDALFGGFQSPLHVPVSHVQAVLELPAGAVHLARAALDEHHAFRIGERAWCVQFHPEFDAQIVRGYIDARRDAMEHEGLDPDALAAAAIDTADGALLLRRFAQFARRHRG